MQLGISSFAEMSPSTDQRGQRSHIRMTELMEEIELADRLGLDVYAIGEHHRADFIASSPATILAAAAVKTNNIRLSSAVTVLGSDDPVRVFQQFATVDLLSNGRAEIMAGRGSFIESFPLFGYDLNDYDELFSEKLDLLIKLNQDDRVYWKGKLRSSLDGQGVFPRPLQKTLPIWIAVGGTPASVVRAGKLGLPLALAIIGGTLEQFVPFVELYKRTWKESGHDPEQMQIGIHCHAYVSESDQQAADEFYPSYAEVMSRLGRERGWGPMSRAGYEQMRKPEGSLFVGSAETVSNKIKYMHDLFKHTRFLAHMPVGPMPHDLVMKSIELYATKVAPVIRTMTKNEMKS